jgi:hypothetical protein
MDARTRAPYRCSASAVVGTERAFGQLTVHATTVAFEPRGLFNSVFAVGVIGRIVHTERRVVVVRARLRPPNSNTAVHLLGDPQRGQAAEARVRLAGRHHAELAAALAAAEYDVETHHNWFSLTVVPR